MTSKKYTIKEYKDSIDKLKNLYKDVKLKKLEEAKNFRDKYPEIFKVSTFELMDTTHRENVHSNVLAYLFDHNLYENAANLLSDFINKVFDENIEKIKSKDYEIKREFYVKKDKKYGSGRIDLLVIDNKNKFVIVIENKIRSSLRYADSETSQLNIYKNFIDKEYKNYNKKFILLTYNEKNESNIDDFIKATYSDIYYILEKNKNSKDNNVINEYKILLNCLINKYDNKIKNLKIDENTNLTTLEQVISLGEKNDKK